MIPRLPAALLGCLLALAPAAAAAGDAPTAQDGQRGFGAQPSDDDLRQLFQAREGPDAEFVAGLRALEPTLRLRLLDLAEVCEDRGLELLLPPEQRRGVLDLLALHAAFEQAALAPEPILAEGDDRARALAAMLLDERLRARARVLAGWEQQADELRRGLDVLAATTNGYVVLSDRERAALGPRVDLAASFLRALGNDLAVLEPRPLDKAARRERAAAEADLLAAGPEELHARLLHVDLAVERMSSMLFSSRLAAQRNVIEARAVREAALAEAGALRRTVLLYLPETEEGQAAPQEIAVLRKHERLRSAGLAGVAGLELDPLDEICAFAAGRAEDFAWGPRRSRQLFDRYLVLRGIRTHDHRTLKGRKLNAWEQQAMAAVTAGF